MKPIRSTIVYSALSLYAAFSLFPVYFSLISSFKENNEIFSEPFAWPKVFHFDNYSRAWELAQVGVYFRNSLILTVGTCLLLVILGSMTSYVFARMQFKGKSFLFIFIIMGMMIPIHSTMIPLAFNIGYFGLRDNMFILIVVMAAFSLSMTIFILAAFMRSIPGELEESAVMDGCTNWQVFYHILIPMSIPAIATVTIFNFLGAWNNLLFPLLFISQKSMMPIAYGLLAFFAERQSDYGGVMAAIVFTIFPPLIIYVLLQEKVEQGLTAGAVKG